MTNQDGYELKPCPFCGSDKVRAVRVTFNSGYSVMCYNCQASGPYDLGKSGAIEKWNERKAEEK